MTRCTRHMASSLETSLMLFYTKKTYHALWNNLSFKNIYLILPVLLVKYATQNQIDPVYFSCEILQNLLSNKYILLSNKYILHKYMIAKNDTKNYLNNFNLMILSTLIIKIYRNQSIIVIIENLHIHFDIILYLSHLMCMNSTFGHELFVKFQNLLQ